jgi:hypothetical protein
MNLRDIPFQQVDWSSLAPTTHPGAPTQAGQGYVVADGDGAHRSRTPGGARLFIVD